MRLTETDIVKRNPPIVIDNRILLDGNSDFEPFEFILYIDTIIGHSIHKTFVVKFNSDVRESIYSTFEKWIKACKLFKCKESKTLKANVPYKLLDNNNIINFLNTTFDTSTGEVTCVMNAFFYIIP